MTRTFHRGRVATLLAALATVTVALLVASASAVAQTGGTTLQAVVGPDPTITLTRDGEPVTSLEAGDYTIEVDDRSENHNFHLTGPGVDETTTVEEVGTTTWQVTFEEGDYSFVCDPHAETMNGSFTVTAAGAATDDAAAPADDAMAPADDATAPAGDAAAPSDDAGDLPFTGLDMVGTALLGSALLTCGVALAYGARRLRPRTAVSRTSDR